MDKPEIDDKAFAAIGAIIASLVIVPTEQCIGSYACYNSGWKFIFLVDGLFSVNLGLMFVQILVVLIIIFAFYHFRYDK